MHENKVLDLINWLNDEISLFSPIVPDGLSEKNGISAIPAPGGYCEKYLNSDAYCGVAVMIIIRHRQNRTAMDTAYIIQETVEKKKNLKDGFVNCKVLSPVQLVDRDGGGYVYALTVLGEYLYTA